ncbi:GNAT family N-acetyltransferase [Klebsiella quasipneumoniae]|uniref:GNAT family N-acetyltransferase n=1 Tax=Klebsiella pneumoniae complex TaxID=3390273 RepID=UPI0024064651|nr:MULTISPECIES: GNAT family N-acetyltransferase [Klebsiella]MDF9972753.1 GNAT family N-acetyltransferase [Klebsiella pneumoniae]HDS4948371.1 GNAT family N-acetyltransferase [Klebsiella aerogenes]
MLQGNTEPQPFVIETFQKGKSYKGLKTFDCGDKVINDYVKSNLKRDGERDNKKIFVLLDPNCEEQLVGFVSAHLHLTGKDELPGEAFPYSLPKAVPVVKISMIAVTNEYQKDGWGTQLLGMALDHALDIASIANDIKGVALDAKEDVVKFYERHRFTLVEATPDENGTCFMFLSIRELQALDAKRKQFEQQSAV